MFLEESQSRTRWEVSGQGQDFDQFCRFVLRYAPPPALVLDIGTGRQQLLQKFSSHGYVAAGIDLRRQGSASSFAFANATSLPFKDGTFGVVSSAKLLDDLHDFQNAPAEEFAAIIHEAWRVLRPGGLLALDDIAGREHMALQPWSEILYDDIVYGFYLK